MISLSSVRGYLLPLSLCMAASSMGCDDGGGDGGTDLGNGTDLGGGTDLGTTPDGGTDMGPQLAPPQVRVVQGVTDMFTAADPPYPIKGIRLCVATPFGVMAQPGNADFNEVAEGEPGYDPNLDLTGGLPARAVTPYLETLPSAMVRVYDEAVVDNNVTDPPSVDCPMTSDGVSAPLDADCTDDNVPCLFSFMFDASTLEDGKFYSLVIQGFVDNTNTCLGGSVPCPDGDAGAGIVEDEDASDIVSGSARVRLVHTVLNGGPVDLCYTADPTFMSGTPAVIATAFAAGTTSDYATTAPATTGMFYIRVIGDDTVNPACTPSPGAVVPVFFSAENAAVQDSTPALAADTIVSIVTSGDVRFAMEPTCGTPESSQSCGAEWARYANSVPLPLAWTDATAP